MRNPSLTMRMPVGADLDATRVAFRADPGAWLPRPARPRGPGRWAVTLRAGLFARTVACEVGPVWEVDYVPWRRVSWKPEDEHGEPVPLAAVLPVLEGELGLESDDGQPVLVFQAGYDPPGGVVGRVADRAALRQVAEGTARRFVSGIIDRLVVPAADVTTGSRKG